MCASIHDACARSSRARMPLFSNCSVSVHSAAIIIWYAYIVDKDEMRCGSGAKGSSCARDTVPAPDGSGCVRLLFGRFCAPLIPHGVPSASGRDKKLRGSSAFAYRLPFRERGPFSAASNPALTIRRTPYYNEKEIQRKYRRRLDGTDEPGPVDGKQTHTRGGI